LDLDESDVGRDGPLELKEKMAPRECGPLNDSVVELDSRIKTFDLLRCQTPGQRGEGFFPFLDALLIALTLLLGDAEVRPGGTVEEEVAKPKEQTEAEPCHGQVAQVPSLLNLGRDEVQGDFHLGLQACWSKAAPAEGRNSTGRLSRGTVTV
jgi:hypothetical protein